jgi:prophage antirepressor-like protein
MSQIISNLIEQTFTFQSQNIRIIFVNNEPWFIAKDIAELLGFSSKGAISNALKDLDKEERSSFEMNTSGGKQVMIFVSESGLYSLIMRSRKPVAKPFQKWVTREVLPQIRKTGSYSLSETPDLSKLKKRAELIHIASNLVIDYKKSFFEIGITRSEELGITVNRAVAKDSTVDFLEIAEKKGLSTPEKYFTVTELCEIVRNGDFSEEAKKVVSTKNGEKPRPQNLNKLLEKEGFQFRENETWKATEKGESFSDFVQNKSKHSEKTVFHTVWKKEILNELF